MADDRRILTYDPVPRLGMPELEAWLERLAHHIQSSTFQEQDTTDEHSQNLNNPHQTKHSQLADISGPAANPHGMVRWRGDWRSGTTYEQFDQVRRGGWLAIANTQTEEDPAPYPLGDKRWITGLGDTPAWTTDSATVNLLIVGLRAMNPAGYLRYNIRVWIPTGSAGQEVEVWSITDPTGNAGATLLYTATLVAGDEGKWLELPLGLAFLPAGLQFDLVAAFASRTGSNSFAGDWDAKRKNGAPSEGEAWHQSGSNGTRIHYVDKDDIDRETELREMSPGDTYTVGGTEYTIDAVVFNANDAHFYHNPTSRPQENLYTYTFTYYGSIPVDYVYMPNGWSSNPNVQGFYSETGYQNGVLDQNMYGVDLEIESVDVSTEWDHQAYTG